MAFIEASLNRVQPYMLAVLRVITALLFLEHGLSKLVGFPNAKQLLPGYFSLLGLAAVIEIVGSVLLVAGFRTRLVAFILAGEMAIGYFLKHAPHSFFPIVNGGEGAILFCFIYLYLATAGGGACSLDRRR